jgi:hypothetical protein
MDGDGVIEISTASSRNGVIDIRIRILNNAFEEVDSFTDSQIDGYVHDAYMRIPRRSPA